MNLLADLLSTVFERRYNRRSDHWAADDRPFQAMTKDLMGTAGEVSGMVVAQSILDRFMDATDDEKLAFFRHLAEGMALQPVSLRAALDDYEKGQDRGSYSSVMAAAEPPRQELIRRLNQVPGATGALVAMRADLLRLARGEPELEALDLDFMHLFQSWFNRGFLVLRPINWESPAHILEKIIAYEAVHAIDSWDDLRRRLQPEDRRCFAFFHPAMADEPLIFVEVALTAGVPNSVQDLLQEDRVSLAAGKADTATFYSISNCQSGLANISFGNSLIKQVVADLAIELGELKTFVILSPMPKFAKWLDNEAGAAATLEPDRLMAFAASYLTGAKRSDGMPLDPVARFHLGNGAEVHRVNLDADTSANGMRQSRGVMVNYLYDLQNVSRNHENFAASHEIAMSSEIRTLGNMAEKFSA